MLKPGTDVLIFQIFSPQKNLAKKGGFLLQPELPDVIFSNQKSQFG
jgi:hypothetical protein